MSADKAPVEKLPLAVRKNGTAPISFCIVTIIYICATLVRDGWENKKPDFEAQLLTLLGTAWNFDINPLAIYPYAEPDSYGHNSLGDCIAEYVFASIPFNSHFKNVPISTNQSITVFNPFRF